MEAKTIDLRHLIRKCPECGQQYSSDSVFCPFDGTKLADVQSWAPNKDSLLGKTIEGRYRVDSVLGEGGMGTVYEVRHTTLARSFALKVLRKDLAEDEELAARFIQEAKATAAVRHPHVVSINDFGRLEDGRPYFVMELLEGQTLSQVIKSGGPVTVVRGARIVSKVAKGLAAAHAAGVVHRDLKPENIVLIATNTDEDVRIVDFGAAMLQGATRLTKAGVVFGTPHYMSPEQAAGNKVDHRVDVYSLGVIMYEMFTGRVPFEGDTYMGVLTQHLYVRPTPPSKVVAMSSLGRLESVILHALEKRPEDRYQSMEELEKEVMRVVQLGSADTAPSADSQNGVRSIPRPSDPDSLEPPTLQEIRESVAGLRPPSPWPVRFMIGAIAVGALAIVLTLFFRKSTPEKEEATTAPSTASIESIAPVVSIIPPAVMSAPASSSTIATTASSLPTSVRPIRTAPTKKASGEFKDPWK